MKGVHLDGHGRDIDDTSPYPWMKLFSLFSRFLHICFVISAEFLYEQLVISLICWYLPWRFCLYQLLSFFSKGSCHVTIKLINTHTSLSFSCTSERLQSVLKLISWTVMVKTSTLNCISPSLWWSPQLDDVRPSAQYWRWPVTFTCSTSDQYNDFPVGTSTVGRFSWNWLCISCKTKSTVIEVDKKEILS